ncbi:MAG TPA: leucyl/phenylalanyl-tRNA--protein transferase [Mycobacteriales bacterium]|nr:leucyl/phenylalanyl-tRNA--protein transferase [Mycobacteriales bacterium]
MHPFDALDVAGSPRELVALGGVLDAPTLRAAYRNGVFPWPPSAEDAAGHDRTVRRLARRGAVPVLPGTPEGPLVPWVSPQPRAVLLTGQVSAPRTVRRLLRRTGWETTLDACFEEVLRRCADRSDGTWITAAMTRAYTALHHEGGAHSVEVWDGSRLVGGLYGVLSGRVFSGESMFFVESGASKVAVLDLCRRLAEAGVGVLDTQQESEHLTAMGQVLVDRGEYVAVVRGLQDVAVTLPADRRTARDLLPAG